jgi:hypothetical protein
MAHKVRLLTGRNHDLGDLIQLTACHLPLLICAVRKEASSPSMVWTPRLRKSLAGFMLVVTVAAITAEAIGRGPSARR